MKEKVICPECGRGRLLDAEAKIAFEKIDIKKITPGWKPEFYIKCPKCGREIAVKKVS